MTILRLLALWWLVNNATVHVASALLAATPRVDVSFLLAVGKVESDLWPVAPISRPHGHRPPMYCGALQTTAWTWGECREQTLSVRLGYLLGANELEVWLDDPRVGGDLRRALLGYCCGYSGLVTGRCAGGYADKVLRVYRELGGEP